MKARSVVRFVGQEVSTIERDVFLNSVVNGPLIPMIARGRILRFFGLHVAHCRIASGCFMGARNLSAGAGTFINRDCFFDGSAPIIIGDRCAIGFRVSIVTGSHEVGGPDRRAGATNAAPVVIHDGAWIGAGATILPGVTIGEGCIIAAGAVVTRDCAPHGLYAGVPAHRLRDLEPSMQR